MSKRGPKQNARRGARPGKTQTADRPGPPPEREPAGNKEAGIVVEGEVTEALPNTTFRITLDTGQETLAHLSGRLRRFRIRVNPGDRVQVELSPYDLTRGRITYRL